MNHANTVNISTQWIICTQLIVDCMHICDCVLRLSERSLWVSVPPISGRRGQDRFPRTSPWQEGDRRNRWLQEASSACSSWNFFESITRSNRFALPTIAIPHQKFATHNLQLRKFRATHSSFTVRNIQWDLPLIVCSNQEFASLEEHMEVRHVFNYWKEIHFGRAHFACLDKLVQQARCQSTRSIILAYFMLGDTVTKKNFHLKNFHSLAMDQEHLDFDWYRR